MERRPHGEDEKKARINLTPTWFAANSSLFFVFYQPRMLISNTYALVLYFFRVYDYEKTQTIVGNIHCIPPGVSSSERRK